MEIYVEQIWDGVKADSQAKLADKQQKKNIPFTCSFLMIFHNLKCRKYSQVILMV